MDRTLEAVLLALSWARIPRLREVVMLRAGDILDLGPLGAKFLVRTGGTPIHLHPRATESYEVLEGKFDVYVDGVWRTLRAGERVAVEPGAPHTFRSSSADVVRVYNTHEPAMRFDQYFEGLGSLRIAASFPCGGSRPKAIVHLAMLMTSHDEEIMSARPPHLPMRIFARVGRSLRYRI